MTLHSGVWHPADRAEQRYRYLPVEVPPGTAALHVTLDYEGGAGGVLDLGCFDAAGEFRGWSGGARSRFTVAVDWATPGYLPGPLAPGTWQVALGLHRVPPDGLPWTVAATASPTSPPSPVLGLRPPPASGRPLRRLPAPPGLAWLAGDLHAHTVHSDGALSIDELAALAAESGLDFLAVTDHNTVSHHAALPAAGAAAGVVLVPGQEVTTDRGHANAFGDIGWIDFRRPAVDWVSTVDNRGGLLSVNHPLGGDCAWLHRLDTRPPLAEVWHSDWFDRTWGAPLAWLLAWDLLTIPIGGSDFHRLEQPERPGRPTTWLACADRTVEGVMDALAAGRVAISESPAGPVLLRVEGELLAIDADGALLVDFSGRRRPVHGARASFPAAPGPAWLEDHRAAVLAMSS